MAPSNERGVTLIELMVSLIIIATIAMALVVMFRLTIVANKFCSTETSFLSNVRKALQGDGPTRGMLFDAQYASSATAVGQTTLALYSPGSVATTYSLSTTNLLRSTGTATTLAAGLTNLSFNYYTLSTTGTIQAAAAAGDARLITFSFQTSLSRGATFYSGGTLKNHL